MTSMSNSQKKHVAHNQKSQIAAGDSHDWMFLHAKQKERLPVCNNPPSQGNRF